MEEEIIECKISQIEIPDPIKKALVPIGNLMTEEMMANPNWDYASGNLPIPKLTPYLSLCFDVWLLICDINDIFENINIVLNDLKKLRERPDLFEKHINGNLRTRYNLLARTFFYEFFRIKECYNIFLGRLKQSGLMKSKDVKEIRSEFYNAFETAIKVRNAMIHSRYLWPGKEHLKLFMAESASSLGGILVNKETGKPFETKEILSELAQDALMTFLAESLTVKDTLQKITDAIVEIAPKLEGHSL